MDFKSLTPHLSVAAQITPESVAELAQAGFRAIVCNRPDGESPDQPSHQAIEAACKTSGLVFRHLPVESGAVLDSHGEAFGALLDALPSPVLAYCRSGTRCTTLWALSQSGRIPPAHIVETAAAAGYDIRGLLSRLHNPPKV